MTAGHKLFDVSQPQISVSWFRDVRVLRHISCLSIMRPWDLDLNSTSKLVRLGVTRDTGNLVLGLSIDFHSRVSGPGRGQTGVTINASCWRAATVRLFPFIHVLYARRGAGGGGRQGGNIMLITILLAFAIPLAWNFFYSIRHRLARRKRTPKQPTFPSIMCRHGFPGTSLRATW